MVCGAWAPHIKHSPWQCALPDKLRKAESGQEGGTGYLACAVWLLLRQLLALAVMLLLRGRYSPQTCATSTS